MSVALEALRPLCSTHAVFLRSEANAVGVDDKALARGRRRRQIVQVRRGAYVFADAWDVADVEGRHRLLVHAVMRTLGNDRVAVSHHSAAMLHGMDLWEVPLDQAHVTRLDGGPARNKGDSVHHVGAVRLADLTEVTGLRVTSAARTAADAASLLDVEHGLSLVNSGLHRSLFTKQLFAAEVASMEGWPNTLHLRLVLSLADGRCTSVGESRTFHFLWAHGLPLPQLQYAVYEGTRLVGIVDFAWPELGLIVEFDGRIKYGALLREGQSPSDVVFLEKRREDEIRRVTGWRVLRLTWADLNRPEQTAALVRSMMQPAA